MKRDPFALRAQGRRSYWNILMTLGTISRFCSRYVILPIIAASFLTACSPAALRQNIELDINASLLGGFVHADPQNQGPIILTAYSDNNGKIQVAGRVRLPQSGAFYLPVPSGMYYLTAFQDSNENEVYDPHEVWARFGAPDLINAASQHFVSDLNLFLGAENKNNHPRLDNARINKRNMLNQALAGKTVLASVLFERSTHVGLGFVKPYYFLSRMGANIWFIEAYSPEKIPILFIHGSGGSPADWQYFAEHLDRSAYQPWFFYYPSGLPLEFSAKILALKIQELHSKYKYDKMAVVAHSMGALVARSLLVQSQKRFPYIELFVSLSAPWGGVESAKLGAQKSPLKVASWRDIATDSYFINALYEHRLPETVRHYLLFGYKSNGIPEFQDNDGVVRLKSMLDNRAQQEAVRVYGFNENHASILKSQTTFKFISKIIREEF